MPDAGAERENENIDAGPAGDKSLMRVPPEVNEDLKSEASAVVAEPEADEASTVQDITELKRIAEARSNDPEHDKVDN